MPTAFSPSSMHDYMRVVWHCCQPSPAPAVSYNLPIQHCVKLAEKCCFGVLQAARLGAPDCNFCESEALTYSTFAECYAAEAEFVPQVTTASGHGGCQSGTLKAALQHHYSSTIWRMRATNSVL